MTNEAAMKNVSAVLALFTLKAIDTPQLRETLSSQDSKEKFLDLVCGTVSKSGFDFDIKAFRIDFATRLEDSLRHIS